MTEKIANRLDELADDFRETASMCGVDSSDGQIWIKVAVELEFLAAGLRTYTITPAGRAELEGVE